jgi:hypothetical protein
LVVWLVIRMGMLIVVFIVMKLMRKRILEMMVGFLICRGALLCFLIEWLWGTEYCNQTRGWKPWEIRLEAFLVRIID